MAQASASGLLRVGRTMPEEVGSMAGADPTRERIEAFPWPRGGVEVVRANRGYTLYSRRTGGQVARLRPTGKSDDVQVLWWRRNRLGHPRRFRARHHAAQRSPRLRRHRKLLLDRGSTPTPVTKRAKPSSELVHEAGWRAALD